MKHLERIRGLVYEECHQEALRLTREAMSLSYVMAHQSSAWQPEGDGYEPDSGRDNNGLGRGNGYGWGGLADSGCGCGSGSYVIPGDGWGCGYAFGCADGTGGGWGCGCRNIKLCSCTGGSSRPLPKPRWEE